MASLIITVNERKQGFDLPAILGKEIVIGCDDACDIVLSGVDGLSHRHCRITCTEAGFELEDMDSTNGTYADEQEVEEKLLMKEGVVYSVGEASMLIAELANYSPRKPKEATAAPAPAKTEPLSTEPQNKTAPLAEETATAPLAEDAATAPLADETATAPICDTPGATAAPTGAKAAPPPEHTRPLPGRAPARRAKLAAKGKMRTQLSREELKEKAKLLADSFKGSGVSTLYVVLVILAAFYAGMVLYSWQTEGTPVPAFFR